MAKSKRHNILYLSTFPPRECGIATFTRDLTNIIDKKFNPLVKSQVVAMNNEDTDIYNYDDIVKHQIAATNIEEYVTLAKKINRNDEIKLVHVQHEFGLFGGEYGNHLIPFFQVIKKPIIITFHSVLPRPGRRLKNTVKILLENAQAIVVMSKLSKEILIKEYEGKKSKIFVIPHGIPQVSFGNGKKEKQKLKLKKRIILSTFGFLSRGKGIEYAIRALPEIVKYYPQTLYLIIGATHPLVRKQEGESYRIFLKQEVERLGLKNNVKFYNKYLFLKEIIFYLKATDIYLHPSIDLNQSVSGSLSYALGCGKPVICTNSSYAKSIANKGKGILVNPRNSGAIKKAIFYLIKNPKTRYLLSRNAYTETRHMTWPNVALAHYKLYRKYIEFPPKEKLPPIILKHLQTLTDSFGVIQFAKHTRPDKQYGYCIDDNARAAIVAAKYWMHSKNNQVLALLQTYLNFLTFSQQPNGLFVNFVTSEKIFNDIEPSEDSQGRTIWALGCLISERALPVHIRNQAEAIFQKAMPLIKKIKSPRAIAFAITGIYFYNLAHPKSGYQTIFKQLASFLLDCFWKTSSKDWPWFENSLTYSNSKLSEAIFYAYLSTGEKTYLEIAERSLRFLIGITFNRGYFESIGQNGWYFRNGKRSYFDQQPEDTSSMAQTLLVAYRVTKNDTYKKYAIQAFEWFLGKNYLDQMVYDEVTGGCYDGLGRYSLNINQGAESTISYLLARLSIEENLK